MLSRRSFLRTTAVAAAAPAVFVKPARATAANDRLTLGFIGVGTQGRGHLGGFLGRDDVQVVAVCDVVKERLDLAQQMADKKYAEKAKSGKYAGCKAFNDFRDLLGDARPGRRRDRHARTTGTPSPACSPRGPRSTSTARSR